MNIYVWEYLRGVTESYHDGGGVLVVAETEERAKRLIPNCGIGDEVPNPSFIWATDPNEVEFCMVFPDAGCC